MTRARADSQHDLPASTGSELGMQAEPTTRSGSRQDRQRDRQRAITEAVVAEGTVRIEQLAERFGISLMTVHRDLDELECRGVLR